MTVLTAFFAIYRDYNLFTLLLFEFIFIEVFILLSIINKIPKHKLNIHTRKQVFKEIFIIYESPKEYLMILDNNDNKTMICKSTIEHIEKSI